MIESTEVLAIKIPVGDKTLLRDIGNENSLTMSDIARLLIADGLEHLNDRNILKAKVKARPRKS
jgi:hypothetical protein